MPHSLFVGTSTDGRGRYIGWTVDFRVFLYVSDRDMWYPVESLDCGMLS